MKKMKKVLASLLAATMVMSMSVTAFAGSVNVGKTEGFTDEATVTFTKTYESKGDGAVSPAETFSFENITFVKAEETGVGYNETWAQNNLPTISTVDYGKGEAGSTEKTETFTITLPENYPSVGIYTYSFKEKDNGVEGVDYNDTTMMLKVTVVEESGHRRVAAIHCEGEDDTTKTDEFKNTYCAGKLSVQKLVEGNMGDKDKEFEITVTFTASTDDTVKSDITYTDVDDGSETTIAAGDGWKTKTEKIYLNHEETITFNNIPEGVSYTVVETDKANMANEKANDTYVATYANESGTIVAGETKEAVVTNKKSTIVDTGIILDSAPYVLLLVLAAVGMFAVVNKKREDEI